MVVLPTNLSLSIAGPPELLEELELLLEELELPFPEELELLAPDELKGPPLEELEAALLEELELLFDEESEGGGVSPPQAVSRDKNNTHAK